MPTIGTNFDRAAACLLVAYDALGKAGDIIDKAYDGYGPHYPYPDSPDARAWDYIDAIESARNDIRIRLETWDGFTNA